MKPAKRLKEIIEKKCFMDLIDAIRKVDSKELVEVQCFYHAVCKDIAQILKTFKGRKITLFDVGCGKRPTMGTFLRLMYPEIYEVVCIDPQLDLNLAKNIKGISLISKPLEEYYTKKCLEDIDLALVCLNHSHVSKKDIKKFLSHFDNWYYATVPCCVDNILTNVHGEFVKDGLNWSPQNILYKYKNY